MRDEVDFDDDVLFASEWFVNRAFNGKQWEVFAKSSGEGGNYICECSTESMARYIVHIQNEGVAQ